MAEFIDPNAKKIISKDEVSCDTVFMPLVPSVGYPVVAPVGIWQNTNLNAKTDFIIADSQKQESYTIRTFENNQEKLRPVSVFKTNKSYFVNHYLLYTRIGIFEHHTMYKHRTMYINEKDINYNFIILKNKLTEDKKLKLFDSMIKNYKKDDLFITCDNDVYDYIKHIVPKTIQFPKDIINFIFKDFEEFVDNAPKQIYCVGYENLEEVEFKNCQKSKELILI